MDITIILNKHGKYILYIYNKIYLWDINILVSALK